MGEIEQYRDAKEWARGYVHKKIYSPDSCVRIIAPQKQLTTERRKL